MAQAASTDILWGGFSSVRSNRHDSRRRQLCRNCFQLFQFGHVGVICESRQCSQVADDRRRTKPRYFSSREYGFWKGLFRKTLHLDETTPCPFCAQPKLVKACPRCRRALDPTTGEVDDHVIAVIGASDSGKSHFLAAVLYQFLEKNVGGDAWAVDFASEDDEEIYRRQFLRPLFEDRRELAATPATEGPELRLLLKHRRTGQQALLAFRDLGGEIFADPTQLERTDFLRYAKGVVLVVDPQAFPLDTVSSIQPWQPNGRPTALDVLKTYRRVLDRLGRPSELEAYPLLPDEKLLAVAVTKADLVLEQDHPFYGDESVDPLAPGFWPARQAWSDAVRDWLAGHIGSALERETRRFADASFFFVSSYGFRHEPRRRIEETPRPRRVHEPILALLDRLGAAGQGAASQGAAGQGAAGQGGAGGRSRRSDEAEGHF